MASRNDWPLPKVYYRGETAVEVYYKLHGHYPPDLPSKLEDKNSTSDNVELSGIYAEPSLEIYNLSKETLTMKGWRTMAVAVAIAALGAVQSSGLADVIPVPYVGPALMAIGFVVAWLRSITNTPVGVK